MLTIETLTRLRVVAAYQMYDSNGPSSLIHPDQRARKMIEKEMKVSSARKSLGLLKRRLA